MIVVGSALPRSVSLGTLYNHILTCLVHSLPSLSMPLPHHIIHHLLRYALWAMLALLISILMPFLLFTASRAHPSLHSIYASKHFLESIWAVHHQLKNVLVITTESIQRHDIWDSIYTIGADDMHHTTAVYITMVMLMSILLYYILSAGVAVLGGVNVFPSSNHRVFYCNGYNAWSFCGYIPQGHLLPLYRYSHSLLLFSVVTLLL